MKTKKIFAVFASLLLLGGFYACSSEEDIKQEEASVEATFSFDADQIITTKTLAIETGTCADDGANLYLELTLQHSSDATKNLVLDSEPLNLYGETYKTLPKILKAGTYTVTNLKVHDGTAQPGRKYYYLGVEDGSALAVFVDDTKLVNKQKIVIDATNQFDKPDIGLYLLCAKETPTELFSMPKFNIDFKELDCFNIMINLCDKLKDNEHIVPTGNIKMYTGTYVDGQIQKLGATPYMTDAFSPTDLGQICFDASETSPLEYYWIEINFFTGTTEDAFVDFAIGVTKAQLAAYKSYTAKQTYDGLTYQWMGDVMHLEFCSECEPMSGCYTFENDTKGATGFDNTELGKNDWIALGGTDAAIPTVKQQTSGNKYISYKLTTGKVVGFTSPLFAYKTGQRVMLDLGSVKVYPQSAPLTKTNNFYKDKVQVIIWATNEAGEEITNTRHSINADISEASWLNCFKDVDFYPCGWLPECLHVNIQVVPLQSEGCVWIGGCHGYWGVDWTTFDGSVDIDIDNVCIKVIQ